jgi:membrane protease YdiL (CAAX protease family)
MHVAKTADFSKESRELILYFLLAYGISLILWLPMLYENSHHHLSIVLLCIGTFGPTLAALITQRISVGNWKAVRLWTGLKNLAIGVASGGALVLLAAFTTAFFMTRSGFDHWRWPALLQIFTLFGPNLLGGPLGEEAGWRGYALPRLQSRFSPVVSSLLLGFLWANWHLPLILAHVYNITWWQFVTMTMAASVFLTYCYNKSKGSTPAAIIVHGLYNVGTGVILNDFIAKATLRSDAAQHNILWATYAGVALLAGLLTKGNLGYLKKQDDDPLAVQRA